ncbi:MAG: bifunctional methylenetetrahydrofolate dehydrogenase/methenyltetrahydrofolate cyclohydrolase FolD [Clostridia bacterium]|nr:bifunctional methylenetetrahydrofolate dehydrogenase/methenyltetrahydrofolate cyclohydrolase FolD [Clostridia bacterium]MBQ2948373.1 bifunctional methylenetetrahydrofolate dehydrogenase/methenyltetrahydrofolate cyclohydrolase FolD [Clostridia bacterium]MBQ4609186.1 bifunctional methylenetetrahydrofolate dehydrogenase/methenyltetrahydrofolate cyclohydrolase FolD [Clostridia bacterium]MBQ6857918.1 bifunctional methylenetetrahydrofolate dehydrogenase/methenyltetrahydrofolate cyclohydrolase FolD 
MAAKLIDGRTVAKEYKEKLALRAQALVESGVTPHLAVVLVGENPASQVYVRNKENACIKAGIRSTVIRLEESCTQAALEETVEKLNADQSVHGILVQLPLPRHLDEARVLRLIDPDKDVDGFHAMNSGRLMNGQKGFVPCTPLGVMELLRAYDIPVEGRHAVVIGRSNIVGKPQAMLLLHANATVTVCHSRTQNLAEITRQADILVAAVGRAGFVTADMVKPGAAVIDVGINRVDGKIVGDVDFEAVSEVAGYLTPVPGGVGQMTIAMLLANTLDAAERCGR